MSGPTGYVHMVPLHHRLAFRQTRTMLLGGLLLGLLVSLVQVLVMASVLRGEVKDQIDNLIIAVRGSATQAVFELDTRLAEKAIDGLLSYRMIRGARILDENGRVLAARSRPVAYAEFQGTSGWLAENTETRQVKLLPTALTGPLGALEITRDDTLVLKTLVQRATVTLYGTLLWAVLIAALLALLFHYSLTRALLQIVARLSLIHPDRPQDAVLVVPHGHEHDELGMLVQSLQELIERYSLSQAAQKQAEDALAVSEARMRAIFDHAPLEMYLKDCEGRYLLVNRRFAAAFNARVEDLPGKTMHDLVDPARIQEIEDLDRAVLRSGQPVYYEHRSLADDTGTFMSVKFPIRSDAGALMGVGGVVINISDRKQAEEALKISEQRFRDVTDASTDAVWELDSRQRFSYVSNRLCELTGLKREVLLGHTPYEAFGKAIEREDVMMLAAEFAARRPYRDARLRFHHHDGQSRDWSLSGKPVWDGNQVFKGYRGTGTDITEAQNLARELAHQASHDGLTGLINRHTFEFRLQRALTTANQEGVEHVLCYIDLDQFKVINDTCGHTAGDALLRQLGQLLGAQVRQRDTLARLGGDEFGVLLERCSMDKAQRVVDTILEAVGKFQFHWHEKNFRIGASIGLASVTRLSASAGEIMAAADSACYAAKDRGRNRYHVYRDDDADLAERHGEMQWVSRINTALETDAFDLFYQTIVPVDSPGCAPAQLHYELLLRMRDEGGVPVPPGAFLPAAERYGLASALDRWVVNTALDWLQGQPGHLQNLSLCAINLSGHSIGDEGFLEYLSDCIERHCVPPEKLCFEITETAAISNLARASVFIQALRSRGCRFALDDFGSGLSSFAYLKSLSVDYLKIDGVFVREIATSAVDRAMVSSINELGHVTGKRTVAEFVEDNATLEVLRELGVDFAQGYGISRPAPIASLLDLPDSASGSASTDAKPQTHNAGRG